MKAHPFFLIAKPLEDEHGWSLQAPGVGILRELPALGSRLQAGQECGFLEVLGVRHPLLLPHDIAGSIARLSLGPARLKAVSYGEELCQIKPQLDAEDLAAESHGHSSSEGGLLFRSPQAGRYYAAPDPDSPPFLAVGDTLEIGRTLGLLEVMKTFNPIKYGQTSGLPPRVKVKAILVQDRDDVEEGTPLLELEA
ncbi:MAG: hypothetical protein O3A95_00170 [Planctomycetota bacterium]|nr:hypothetical protein [Planctomycetota bacterium]MDA1112704.1 hypothetical protein [Planctomycetota bacterium]